MKSKDRVPRCYKEGTQDWEAEYNMLLDDGVTCNDCIHVSRCTRLFGQGPYVNDGKCQFYPNKFMGKRREKSSEGGEEKL